jgi:flagellar hook-associated protein 3 FlgL
MRISNPGIAARLLSEISTSQSKLQEAQDSVSSGKRIQKPSDDPFGASRVMTYRTQMDVSTQYQRNVELANNELGVSESALTNLNTVLQRASELSVQAGNASLDGPSRNQIASEVDRLIEETVSIGNTQNAGRYIFSGFQTNTPPFAPDVPANPTVVTYAGDAGKIQRQIGDAEKMDVNIPGSPVFGPVFSALIAFRDHLRTNNVVALQTDPQTFDASMDTVLQNLGTIGANVRRLDLSMNRLQESDLTLKVSIGKLEDADLIDSAMQLQLRNTGLQAALASAGKSLSVSLLDFLR